MSGSTRVFWKGHNGAVFTLLGDGQNNGVVLVRPKGLTSKVDREFAERSNGYGSDIRGRVFPHIEGSLDVEVFANTRGHQTPGEVWEAWKRSWSTEKPGELSVMTSTDTWTLELVASQLLEEPERAPSSTKTRHIPATVAAIGLDAIWSGVAREFTGGGVYRVHNAGSVTAFPVARWSGAGHTIKLPDGRTVTLPTVSQPHTVTLDPGMGFKVWGPTGQPATSVWAAFRGRDLRGSVPAGQTAEFTCTPGVDLLFTPLHENPWG